MKLTVYLSLLPRAKMHRDFISMTPLHLNALPSAFITFITKLKQWYNCQHGISIRDAIIFALATLFGLPLMQITKY